MRLRGMVIDGIEAVEVTVEAQPCASLRTSEVRVVGLPDTAVREGMFRARAAVRHVAGERADNPGYGVLVNLAPADVRKTGRSLDLPLAMTYAAMLLGIGDEATDLVFLGEVGLGGVVRPVGGVVAAVLEARRRGRRGVVLPRENLPEARLVEGPVLFPARTVQEAFLVLRGEADPDAGPRGPGAPVPGRHAPDLAEVRGQFQARRALEVACAGRHNLLLEGPPGSGKTMLVRRVPGVLPRLDEDEALEVARIHSVVRQLEPTRIYEPPFRAPHHTATPAGLAGGGQPIRPGEFSLAHRGVLFLDEFPEFDRRSLEVLREPMEERAVHITRASGARRFPADFLLVAAMNPCPCGYFGLRDGRCRCTPRQVRAYRGRLSGPLLDRFDMRLLLRPVPPAHLLEDFEAEPSAAVRERVITARQIQRERYRHGSLVNGQAPDRLVRRAAGYGPAERRLLLKLVTTHRLSARATRRLERVARTVADLAGSERTQDLHLMEALGFRLGGHFEQAADPS